MPFDLNSILQNEISKKQQQIENEQNKSVIKQESEMRSPKATEQVKPVVSRPKLDKIVKKKTRPTDRTERIQMIMAKESKLSTKIEVNDIGNDEQIERLSIHCNLYIHSLLRSWDECKSQYQPNILEETKRNLFPLLVSLRRHNLPREQLISLASILYHLQKDEINLSLQSYMKLSIGNVAWPIGVTSVGIHARSAHSKITGTDNVASIMINEETRLWVTSIKRLVTFREWQLKISKISSVS